MSCTWAFRVRQKTEEAIRDEWRQLRSIDRAGHKRCRDDLPVGVNDASALMLFEHLGVSEARRDKPHKVASVEAMTMAVQCLTKRSHENTNDAASVHDSDT